MDNLDADDDNDASEYSKRRHDADWIFVRPSHSNTRLSSATLQPVSLLGSESPTNQNGTLLDRTETGIGYGYRNQML